MLAGVIYLFYPNTPGSHFNWDYYLNVHIPMAIEEGKPHLKDIKVYKGIAGPDGKFGPYLAIAECFFDHLEAAERHFSSEVYMKVTRGRTPNYTEITPIVQFVEYEHK